MSKEASAQVKINKPLKKLGWLFEFEHILDEGNKKLIKIYEQKNIDTLTKLWE